MMDLDNFKLAFAKAFHKIMEWAVDNQQFSEYKGSISMTLVHEALFHVEEKGFDLQQILYKAEIPFELLHSPKARISVPAYARLWTEIANQMNDEFFGMDSHPMRRGSYKLLSKMVMYADTLSTAIEQILQYFNFILDDFHSKLIIDENYAYIVITDKLQTKRMFCYATYFMLVHSLICWLADQRILLNHMRLKCTQPIDDLDYRVRFCEKISYQADNHYLQFDANYLNIQIKRDKKSWYDFIRNTPENLLLRFKNPHALSSMIRKQLLSVPPAEWCELSELAQQLNISEATIQRRLKNEGISYQQLKNDIRRDLAIDLLCKSSHTLQEISEQLHFQEPSAFHRAFKKWTGVSPGAYRELKIL